MLKRAIAATTIASAVMLSLLFYTTTPATAGPVGILGFFVFMYLTALGVLTFLFRGVSIIAAGLSLGKFKKPAASSMPLRKAYYYASIAASAPVMLIAMHSVGQVGPYQVLLVVIFVAIGWVYVANRTS